MDILQAENIQTNESRIAGNVIAESELLATLPSSMEGKNDVNVGEGSNDKKKRKVGENSTNATIKGPDAGDSGTSKACKTRSWVWKHFTKDDHPTNPRATCNWCAATYAADSHRNGTTNLRIHLLSQCKKFPKESLDPSQQTLTLQQLKKEDGNGTGSTLVAVHFDVEACRKALARMIIVDELPFKFVEGEGFRYFMSVVQPRFSIPSRISAARDCWDIFTDEKHKLKSIFRRGLQSVSLTTDCWTSVQNMSYLCLTAHFIDQDWKLHKRILNFCPILDHRGVTIGRKIEKCLEEWQIDKVFTITVDNASSNDVAISYLKGKMEDWNSHPLKGEYLHVRCCAHILNLVVKDGLTKIQSSISKIRNAVRYVRQSPGRMDRFRTCIREARVQEKCTVQLDVSTRWNSTYLMLDSAIKFQKAFKRLSEKCAEFSRMEGGVPKNEDWENAKSFVKFLKIFYDITNKVSGSNVVTSSQYFNEHVLILTTFKKWIGSSDKHLGDMAGMMKGKYDKYWGNVKNVNLLIYVAVVLDPRNKMQFVKWGMNKCYEKELADFLSDKVKETLQDMFDRYKLCIQGQSENQTQSSNDMEVEEHDVLENALDLEFEKDMSLADNMNVNEVDLYLMEGLEKKSPNFDILNWWKVNSTKYPILAQVARDVLAMPVSTVASESAFSTGGRVLNCYRSSLTPKTVEALVCAQNWCRSAPIASDVEDLLEDLEQLELGNFLFLNVECLMV